MQQMGELQKLTGSDHMVCDFSRMAACPTMRAS